ncbi:AsnC family transcriptional regulator [Streptomyces kurssanovii]|nr:AsnC family transcriptional regulator [Streptomyces kurssanovii]
MDPVTLDALDRRLLHALQLDGRAPFSRIAGVLDTSDRTVARRFERLRAAGAVRVSAVPHSRTTGHAEWLVRMRVVPHGAADLARTLARRSDTGWVTVLSSGTGIACLFRVPDLGPAPLAELSRHPHVSEVSAQQVLRHLMDDSWAGRTSALTAQQVAALRQPDAGGTAPIPLTDLDRRLLPALAADGRAACAELARRVDWSESAVRRRLESLRRDRVLRFQVEVEPALFGFSAQCVLWLSVSPSMLAAVAADLAADPATAYLGATTGSHNLFAVAVCRNPDALYSYVTDRVGSSAGVERVETGVVSSYTKRFAPVPAGPGRRGGYANPAI